MEQSTTPEFCHRVIQYKIFPHVTAASRTESPASRLLVQRNMRPVRLKYIRPLPFFEIEKEGKGRNHKNVYKKGK